MSFIRLEAKTTFSKKKESPMLAWALGSDCDYVSLVFQAKILFNLDSEFRYVLALCSTLTILVVTVITHCYNRLKYFLENRN